MDAELRRWLEAELDGSIISVRRTFGGGSRKTWFVEVAGPAGTQPVVVRHDDGTGALSGSDFSLAREAVVYRALQATGVPIAELLAVGPAGSTLVLTRLPGTARLPDADPTQDAAVVIGFFDALGRLHRLDPADLELPGFVRPSSAAAHALDDLTRWRRFAERNDLMPEPMIAFAFAWLDRNAPVHVDRTVLVQGDTGPGNFLHVDGRVTGLVDWEFAHLGDPMDDIAWIDMRAGTDGAFGDTEQRDRRYRRATGVDVDPDRVRYYAVLVRLRCALTTGNAIHRGGGTLGLHAYMAPHHRFLTQLGGALAEAMGFSPTLIDLRELPADGVDEHTNEAIDHLRIEIADLRDAGRKLSARERLLALEHDDATIRFGQHLRALDAADVRTTLGVEVVDADLTARARSAAAGANQALLDLLLRRAQRRQVLWDTPAAGGPSPLRPPDRPR